MIIRYETVRLLQLDFDRATMLVEWRSDVKDVQHGCDDDVEHRVGEVSPGAFPMVGSYEHVQALGGSRGDGTYRLPKPKMMDAGSRTSSRNRPFRIKRSGLKVSGSGYISGSCIHALKVKIHQLSRCFLYSEGVSLTKRWAQPLSLRGQSIPILLTIFSNKLAIAYPRFP